MHYLLFSHSVSDVQPAFVGESRSEVPSLSPMFKSAWLLSFLSFKVLGGIPVKKKCQGLSWYVNLSQLFRAEASDQAVTSSALFSGE